MTVKTSKYTKKVFKTKEGFLHNEISEGWWLEDDERNYEFTYDIFQAYDFSGDDTSNLPKYIEVTHDEDIKNHKQLCEVLGGEFAVYEITIIEETIVKEIQKYV